MTKWVLVTGGARRIGRAIALELAAAGWDIILHYNNGADDAAALAEEIQDFDVKVCLAQIDLAQSELVAKLIPALVADLGPLTALVNNASLFAPDAMADAARLQAVNLEAPRLLSEAFRQQLPPNSTGAILNLLDADPTQPDFRVYNASKQALAALTVRHAAEFAPKVRVNGLALGDVLPGPRQSQAHFDARVDATPLQSPISPQDVAAAARFLIENAAITGEILHLDGGRHLLAPKSDI